MKIRNDRIQRAQALMQKEGMIGIMIMNHDDYRFFFGTVRVQPRAIIPAAGSPIFICFAGEGPELRRELGDDSVKIFTHVGEQISDVRKTFLSLFGGPPPGVTPTGKPKVGMQLWFHTPAFLVDLFRKVNPQVDLVSSDPVMDELRMVKEPEELNLMKKAQSVAGTGMNLAKEMLRPGVTGSDMAREILYTMMKEGAEGTSAPIHINSGARTCWIHGKVDATPIQEGDLVVVNLTPQVEGYCANLARTFVVGTPTEPQRSLARAYLEMREVTRQNLKPDVTVGEIDSMGKEVCSKHGLGEFHINGISHGIGLRFEETPASTILPPHRSVKIREDMTMTIGHTILADPAIGGVRFEDVYRVTPDGGECLAPHPVDFPLD